MRGLVESVHLPAEAPRCWARVAAQGRLVVRAGPAWDLPLQEVHEDPPVPKPQKASWDRKDQAPPAGLQGLRRSAVAHEVKGCHQAGVHVPVGDHLGDHERCHEEEVVDVLHEPEAELPH
eukprot:5429705-Pyramimonas_sp.AAC.1